MRPTGTQSQASDAGKAASAIAAMTTTSDMAAAIDFAKSAGDEPLDVLQKAAQGHNELAAALATATSAYATVGGKQDLREPGPASQIPRFSARRRRQAFKAPGAGGTGQSRLRASTGRVPQRTRPNFEGWRRRLTRGPSCRQRSRLDRHRDRSEPHGGDNNGADTGDRFSLDTKLTVLSIDATGAMLQVSGPNIDGKPTVGFVRKDFVQLDQTPDGPQPPPGSTTPTPGPAPSQGTIDPAIGPALRAALKENEIGNASPYRLSYAKLGQSGASFGVFQGDTHVNPKARSTLLQVLLQSGIASADAESIVNAVSVALPAGSPFSEAVNIQIDTALASSSGRALVDAMDEETFADVEAKLTNCLQIVGSRHATLEAPAQIACTLWINMNGGLTLRKWLEGDVEYGVQPVAAPNVTRGNIETFLKNTDYFVLHPQNFRHFSDSVNAGVGVLPAALNQGQSAFWIYAQSSGRCIM